MTDFSGSVGFDLLSLVENKIKTTCIIDFGFILEVIDKDFVLVQIGSATDNKFVRAFNCVMGSTASSNFTVKVDPKEGDKVIVFYPRTFDFDMFDTDKNETAIDLSASGYSQCCGIAFLANQFFVKPYAKNYLRITDNSIDGAITDHPVTLRFGVTPNEDDGSAEKYNASLEIKDNGAFTYTITDGSDSNEAKASLAFTADGKFTFTVKDKLELTLREDGNISIDAKNGKFTFTNSMGKSLNDILGSLCDNIKNLQTYGSPALHSVSPASQALVNMDKTNLANLLG
jgi:hypothetical protein